MSEPQENPAVAEGAKEEAQEAPAPAAVAAEPEEVPAPMEVEAKVRRGWP